MGFPHILHHGDVCGVTGSCHQLLMDTASSLLVDCGLFQCAETSPEGKAVPGWLAIKFAQDGIKALIATHVHIDHVGRIPYLLVAGFKGPIICSEPSAKLLPIVLGDSFKLGVSLDQKQVERYLKLLEQRIVVLPYKHWFSLVDTPTLHARIRLQRAGHILGSAYVEIDQHYPAEARKKKSIVFSSDLGMAHGPILPAPKASCKADVLVSESTYCDRLHESRRARRQRLEKVLEHALSNLGTVLIPAFSIGRTQELLYELDDIIYRKSTANQSPRPLEERGNAHKQSQLDSPLASRFTRVYWGLDEFWDAEALSRLKKGRNPSVFRNLLSVDSHQVHLAMVNRLTQTAQLAIVPAGTACAPVAVSSLPQGHARG